MLKLFFSDAPARASGSRSLRAMRARNERKLDAAARARGARRTRARTGPRLTLQLGIEITEWIIEWCEATERRLAAETRRTDDAEPGSPPSCTRTAAACSCVAVLGAVVAGAFGAGVAEQLSPYGANDPATQSRPGDRPLPGRRRAARSTRAWSRSSSGRSTSRSAAATGRVARSPRQLRAEPRRRAGGQLLRHATTRRWSRATARSTYVARLLQAALRQAPEGRRPADREPRSPAQRDVTLGGAAIANAQANTQVSHDLAHARAARVPVHLPALAAVLPLAGGGAAAAAARRPGDRGARSSRCGSSRASPTCRCSRSTSSPASGSGWRSTTACSSSPATARRRPPAGSASRRCGARCRPPGARSCSARSRSPRRSPRWPIFPQRFLYSMGIAGALVALLAAALALIVLPALLAVLGPRVNALAPRRLPRAAERDARPAASGRLVPAVAVRDAPPGADRGRERGGADRARDPVHRHQVHHGRRERAARQRERAAGRRRAAHRSSRRTAPRRSRSSSARPADSAAGARAGGADPRAARSRRRSRRAQPAGRSSCRCSRWRPSHDPLSDATQQLVRDVRAIARAVLRRRRRPDGRLRRPRAQPRRAPAGRARDRGRRDADRAVPDDRLGRAADQGGADERAQPERRVRDPGADLPGRQPAGPASLPQPGRARRDAADPPVRGRASGWPPTTACSCSSRIKEARDARRLRLGGGRHRARADRPDRHRGRAAVRGRDRRVRHLEARVHQGARASAPRWPC